MDLKDIKQLLKIVDDSQADEVRLEQDDFKIVIKKNRYGTPGVYAAPPMHAYTMSQPLTPATGGPVGQVSTAPADPTEKPAVTPTKDAGQHEVTSPIVGTFYQAPAPDADAYVKIGDRVSVGDVLCIVEAMKLMNEIECDVSGTIEKIMVANGTPVEYGQPLFLIRKS